MILARLLERWRREPNINIRRIYALTIAGSAQFYLPVVVPYYRDVAGLDFASFLLAESFFAGAIVLLELPTGYLSDIWQRRSSIALSQFFWVIATIYLVFANSLFDMIAIQLIMALAVSFESGTTQATLYEYLAQEGRESEFRKVEGQRFAYQFYTLVLATLPAGLLYAIDPRLPVAMTVVSFLIMLGFSLRLQEPARAKRGTERNAVRDMLQTMRYALIGHREIAAIIMLAAVMFSASKLIMWAQQPYYAAAGIPVAWNGLLSAAAFGLLAINSQMAHRLERWLAPVALLGVILLIEIGSVALASSWVIAPFAVFMLIGHATYGLGNPVVGEIINQRAEPERRATILSTQSLMTQLLFMAISVPYGWIADQWGIAYALQGLAALIIGLGIPAWLMLRARIGDVITA